MEGDLTAPAEEKTEVAASPTCCVTGATGYIGSWLVKLLLERGYKVQATVRNPGSIHLISLIFTCKILRNNSKAIREDEIIWRKIVDMQACLFVMNHFKYIHIISNEIMLYICFHFD